MSYWLSKLFGIGVVLLVNILFYIPIILLARKEHKRFAENILEADRPPSEITITLPRYYSLVGLVTFTIFFCSGIFMYIQTDVDLNIFGIIVCFVLSWIGIFIVFCAKNWSLVLTKDNITVYRPVLDSKTIEYDEITSVKENSEGINVYIDKKCIFMLPSTAAGYQIIYAKLRNLGKFDSASETNSATITKGKGNIIGGIILIAIAICSAIGAAIKMPDDENIIGFYALLAIISIYSLYVIIESLRWKIHISGNTLSVSTMFSHRKYILAEITSSSETATALTVKFTDGRKLKISNHCENYGIFKEFIRQGILLYSNKVLKQ